MVETSLNKNFCWVHHIVVLTDIRVQSMGRSVKLRKAARHFCCGLELESSCARHFAALWHLRRSSRPAVRLSYRDFASRTTQTKPTQTINPQRDIFDVILPVFQTSRSVDVENGANILARDGEYLDISYRGDRKTLVRVRASEVVVIPILVTFSSLLLLRSLKDTLSMPRPTSS